MFRKLQRLVARMWAQWRRDTAAEELVSMQARCDVGPIYLCGLMAHISELDWQIADLS